MEKNFARPLADSPNIERDRRRSVSEMWTSLLCNIETDAAASVAGLEERYFCKHRYFAVEVAFDNERAKEEEEEQEL